MTARREELGLGPVSENSKYEIFDFIEPSASLRESWQRSINVLAKATNVPAALIMRVHSQEIEVFLKSQTDGNVYEMGERAQLDTGLYCETVMSTGQELLVPKRLDRSQVGRQSRYRPGHDLLLRPTAALAHRCRIRHDLHTRYAGKSLFQPML